MTSIPSPIRKWFSQLVKDRNFVEEGGSVSFDDISIADISNFTERRDGETNPSISGSQVYLLDDWGDNALTDRDSPLLWHHINPTDGRVDGRFRPEWTVESGSPEATGGSLRLPDGDSNQIVETDSDFTTGEWVFDFSFDSEPSEGIVAFGLLYEDQTNRYYVELKDGGGGGLTKEEDDTTSRLIDWNDGDWGGDAGDYTVRVTRNRFGRWELYLNGESQGSETDTFTPEPDVMVVENTSDVEVAIDNLAVKSWHEEDASSDSFSTNSITNIDKDRQLWQDNKTVTVDPSGGEDYESIQSAIDDNQPYLYDGVLTVELSSGTYDEDVTVANAMGADRGGDAAVVIAGDVDARGDYDGIGLAVKNCTGRVEIRGVTIDREHPYNDESTGVIAYNSVDVIVRECDFTGITNGITAYSSYVEVSQCDFGEDELEEACRIKHAGKMMFQKVDGENITGNATRYGVDVEEGMLLDYADASLTGDEKDVNIHQGIAFDENNRVTAASIDQTSEELDEYNELRNLSITAPDTSDNGSSEGIQRTDDISADDPTSIWSPAGENALLFEATVVGRSGSEEYFIDSVVSATGEGVTRVDKSERGSPPARDYSLDGRKLEVEFDSGPVNVVAKGTGYNIDSP